MANIEGNKIDIYQPSLEEVNIKDLPKSQTDDYVDFNEESLSLISFHENEGDDMEDDGYLVSTPPEGSQVVVAKEVEEEENIEEIGNLEEDTEESDGGETLSNTVLEANTEFAENLDRVVQSTVFVQRQISDALRMVTKTKDDFLLAARRENSSNANLLEKIKELQKMNAELANGNLVRFSRIYLFFYSFFLDFDRSNGV